MDIVSGKIADLRGSTNDGYGAERVNRVFGRIDGPSVVCARA
ncbi:hypothetical protein ACIGNX_22280 [Actinosynnema sp. NPDC053489]